MKYEYNFSQLPKYKAIEFFKYASLAIVISYYDTNELKSEIIIEYNGMLKTANLRINSIIS